MTGSSKRRLGGATLFAAAIFCATSTMAMANMEPVFGAKERSIKGVSLLSKWVRVLKLTVEADAELPECNGEGNAAVPPCRLSDWQDIRDQAINILDRRTQMQFVNRQFNEQPYILDITNWGVSDYWETPKEFKMVSGDCEDYAIAKFLMLRELGWPEEAMRIAVVHDTNLDIGHAVLIVDSEDISWVLDNQTRTPLQMDRVLHYVPFYSFNSETTWLHRY